MKNHKKPISCLISLAIIFFAMACTKVPNQWELNSPNGQLKLTLNVEESLQFSLNLNGNKAIALEYMEFRLYDEGLGFRYRFYLENQQELILSDEFTLFRFNNTGTG